MKKFGIYTLTIILTTLLLCGCGSNSKNQYSRNPNYTYGEIPNGGITAIYTLMGEQTQTHYDVVDSIKTGMKGSLNVTTSETNSGGVVAYGGGMYVYSPDKNDKSKVTNALMNEYLSKK